MTEEELSAYCGVILLFLAKQENGGQLSIPRYQIDALLERTLDRSVSENIVDLSIGVLNRCGVSYIENDSVTGPFINISNSRFKAFIDGVVEDRSQYDRVIASSDDPHLGINQAESRSYRYLDAYNQYPAIRKYAQFGDEWARLLIVNLKEGLLSGKFVPASDRIVLLSDNSAGATKIVEVANNLREQLLKGNDLGNLSPLEAQAAAAEVAQMAIAFSDNAVRAEPTHRRARSTLEWIGKEAAGALVGTVALALLALIAKFLGF